MSRLVTCILAALVAWLGLAGPSASAVEAPFSSVQTVGYDNPTHPTEWTYTVTKRGPPASSRTTTRDATGRWSRGLLARIGIATPGPTTNYTTRAEFVQAARAAGTTLTRVQGDAGNLAAAPRSEVAAESVPARFAVGSSGETTMFLHNASGSLEVTEHAALRMTERGVSIDAAESTLSQQPFRYYHQDVWKTGYYDPTSKLFLGTVNGRVTTVITRAAQSYINNLKAALP